jgi:hypothetical protein
MKASGWRRLNQPRRCALAGKPDGVSRECREDKA